VRGRGDKAPRRAPVGGVRVPPHTRWVLDNGAVLVVVPQRDVPLVACSVLVRGSALADPRGKSGVAALTAGLLEKGAGARDAFAFADALEGVGGSLATAAGAELITLSAQFLARDQELMLGLLASALTEPRFEQRELDTLRARHVELIKAAKDIDPAELLATYGRSLLFRAHPYGRPVLGSERSLGAITRRDILRYYRTQIGGDRLVLIFAGDVDAPALKQSVARTLGRFRRAAAPLPVLAEPARPRARRVLLVDSPGSQQTYFWIGAVGVAKHYPRRAALDLVNTVFGGSFTSLLNTELRVKSGMTYGAGSTFVRGTVAAEFAIRSFVHAERTGEAIQCALATLARLKREGISAAMLEAARAYVLGQYPLSLETAADWAAALGELEAYGLPREYIEQYGPELAHVTLADARRVIGEAFPDPARLAIVAIGDAARIRSQLAPLGGVQELPLARAAFR
jgi:predicted Zn-dependent peptidase